MIVWSVVLYQRACSLSRSVRLVSNAGYKSHALRNDSGRALKTHQDRKNRSKGPDRGCSGHWLGVNLIVSIHVKIETFASELVNNGVWYRSFSSYNLHDLAPYHVFDARHGFYFFKQVK